MIPTMGQKLHGIGEYQSEVLSSHIVSSIEGGRIIQINGEEFEPSLGAADHSIFFKGDSSTEQGPALSNDFDFLSSIQAGKIYYETPQIDEILPTSVQGTVSSLSSVLHVKDSGAGAAQRTYACDSDSDCDIEYDMKYTPQAWRTFPSIVYSGQDL